VRREDGERRQIESMSEEKLAADSLDYEPKRQPPGVGINPRAQISAVVTVGSEGEMNAGPALARNRALPC
jgi:hypothetical protein